MRGNNSAKQIALSDWHWKTETNYSNDQIRAAAAVAAVQFLQCIAVTLDAISSQLQSLGADGIHDVIRAEARRVRRARKIAAGKRRARRLAKKAAEALS